MRYKKVTHLSLFAAAGVSISLLPISAVRAQTDDSHPIRTLGEAVEVIGYPINDGEQSRFRERRVATVGAVIADVEAAYGQPILTDAVEQTHVLLSYPRKLVAITGRYSNGIICRIEIDTSALRLGFTVDETVSLAARSCRKAEEDGWGRAGLTQLAPIGISGIPELNEKRASVYATNNHNEIVSILVRELEVLSGNRASLVRKGATLIDPSPQEGEVVWRYAWFENGDLLLLRWREPKSLGRRYEGGLVCSVVLKSSEAPSGAVEAFSNWCDSHFGRLLPELDAFFDAVREYRLTVDRRDEPIAVKTYSGFHFGEFPVDLTARYWETGKVDTQ